MGTSDGIAGNWDERGEALFTFLPLNKSFLLFLPLKAFLVKRGIISHSAYFPIQKFWHSVYQALPAIHQSLSANLYI